MLSAIAGFETFGVLVFLVDSDSPDSTGFSKAFYSSTIGLVSSSLS